MRSFHESMDKRMFDFERFYAGIVELCLKDGCVIAEIGIADGASAIFLAETVLNSGIESFKFYLIDSLAYGGADQLHTVMQNVAAAGLSDYIEIIPMDSLNASCRFPDGKFDFVFIDASHKFEQTKADVRLWYRKVKEDGILAGHDYTSEETEEVRLAVDIVIPSLVIRTPEPSRQFPAEQVLRIEQTPKGYGVWWMKSKWYVRLN